MSSKARAATEPKTTSGKPDTGNLKTQISHATLSRRISGASNRESRQVKGKEVHGLDYRFVRERSPRILLQRC